MARFAGKVYYETFMYREVEAKNRQEALDKAYNDIDATEEGEWLNEISNNLTNVNDEEITKID